MVRSLRSSVPKSNRSNQTSRKTKTTTSKRPAARGHAIKKSTKKNPKEDTSCVDLKKLIRHVSDFKTGDLNDACLKHISLGCTTSHSHLKDEVLQDCVVCLGSYGDKWKDVLVETDYVDVNGKTTKIPKFIKAISGHVTNEKIFLCNEICIDWQAVTKKKSKSKKEQKCPWYQPCTQSQRLRTFFANMQKKYEWEISIDDLDGEHQLGPFMAKLYEIRFNKFQEDGYAQPNKKRRMTEDDMHLIDLSKFDEDDPHQHIMKILFGCGSEFGFRGKSEHTLACIWQIKIGRFPVGHEWYGHQYVAFIGMCDKTHKLSLKNTSVRDEEEFHRLPVIEDDPKNLGASIMRYLKKVDDDQVRLYCKPMNKNSKRLY